MKQIFFFFFLLTPNLFFGQNEYSIKKYDSIFERIIGANSIKEANDFSNKLIKTGKIEKDSLLIALGYKFKGTIQFNILQKDSSTYSYQKGLKYLNTNKEKLYADIVSNIGRNYGEKGIFDSMQHYHDIAKPIYKRLKNNRGLSILYYSQSSNYLKSYNLFQAEKSLNQLLIVSKEYNDPIAEGRSYYALGILNISQKNYLKGKELFKKAIQIFEKENDLIFLSGIYSAMSSTFLLDNDFDNAEKWTKKGIHLVEKENLPIRGAIIELYSNQFKILLKKNKIEEAESILKKIKEFDYKSLEVFKPIIWLDELTLLLKKEQLNDFEFISNKYSLKDINPEFKSDYYLIFSKYYSQRKMFNKANTYKNEYWRLKDSVLNFSLQNRVIYNQAKFETEKKEKENFQLKADNVEQELLTQKANTRNWLLAFGLFALGTSSFFIWRRYKSEAKAKQIISEQKSQIEKLQKEFHHRIKNDFRSINSFIRLAQKKFPETEFQERLNELKNRVTSMFKVHELLLQQDDITHVKAKSYLTELSENVKQKYNSSTITLNYNVEDIEVIVADKSVPFGVILNEFVTNSYKHAFDEKGGNISVSFHSDAYNHYLTLKDNGKGLPSNFDASNLRSFGLEIMPLLAEQYDGEFKLESDNGVSVIVSLPKQIV